MAVPGNTYGKPITWNKLKDLLPAAGYFVEGKKKRIAGRLQQCYFISGTWQDAEQKDSAFMKLAGGGGGCPSEIRVPLFFLWAGRILKMKCGI